MPQSPSRNHPRHLDAQSGTAPKARFPDRLEWLPAAVTSRRARVSARHTSITRAPVSLSCPRNNPASTWSASLRRRESSLISDQLKRARLSDRGIASATLGCRSPRSIGGQWILTSGLTSRHLEPFRSIVTVRCRATYPRVLRTPNPENAATRRLLAT